MVDLEWRDGSDAIMAGGVVGRSEQNGAFASSERRAIRNMTYICEWGDPWVGPTKPLGSGVSSVKRGGLPSRRFSVFRGLLL